MCHYIYIWSKSILPMNMFSYWRKLYVYIYYAYRIVIDLVQTLFHGLKNTAYLVCINKRCLHPISDIFFFFNRLM